MKSPLIRFIVAVLLLGGTMFFMDMHRRKEVVLSPEKLSGVPLQVSSWTGRDVPLDAQVLEVLGPDGDYLTRLYQSHQTPAWMDLYVAYFKRSRSGDTLHSPKNCLPGAGWTFLSSGTKAIPLGGSQPLTVGRYVIANGDARQLVFYWYQAHGRTYTNEYLGKIYFIEDAIRLNRTDGALVRVITPIIPAEGEGPAEARATAFVQELAPSLHRYIPD